MRIESVTAHAFGPLSDARLELAPGMTVVAGVNESAKSSWHAAIYAALTGRRRGKGAPTKEERAFVDKHRPWDQLDWRVSAVVVLDDGRRVELVHDLDGRVDCRATDLDLGRDVSAEIMHDGAPDASRWMGLDRRTFAATACVSQAQLLSVLASADGLQEHLQRAASTAGGDATAAAALGALERFAREHVGRDAANSTRPLRVAKNRREAAQADLERALSDHQQYLALVEDADAKREQAEAARRDVSTAEERQRAVETLLDAARNAAAADEEARRAASAEQDLANDLRAESARLSRIEELHAAFPDGPPADHDGTDRAVRAVTEALAAWRAVPEPSALEGPSADDLAAELARLPDPPEGDTAVSPDVRSAASRYEQAVAVAEAHDRRRPQLTDGLHDRADVAAAVTAGPAVLRDLASQLNGSAGGEPDLQELDDRLEQARRALAAARAGTGGGTAAARSRRRGGLVGWAVAALAAVAAVVLGVAGQLPAAVGAGVVAVAGAAAALWLGRSGQRSGPASGGAALDVLAAQRSVDELEARRAVAVSAAQEAAAVRAEVEARARARQLPADPEQLRQLAALADRVIEERAAFQRWQQYARDYAGDVAAAGERLRAALHGRGQPAADDTPVEEALRAYEDACSRRAEAGRAAARRESLETALAARRREEAAAAQADQRRRETAEQLRSAAVLAGAGDPDDDPPALATRLQAWQREQVAAASGREQRQRGWAELTTLLAGATVREVRDAVQQLGRRRADAEQQAQAARQVAAEAARRRDDLAAAAGITGPLDEQAVAGHLQAAKAAVESARGTATRLAALAEHAEGVLAERARSLTSVAEAEEEVAAATAELERVTELSRTLTLTQEFLTRAQEQVHRDFAPVIAATLRSWLSAVTEGRYVDATVDPVTLQVQVCGPDRRWRLADRLSVGTAEQVYLLLRVALVEYLTAGREPSPLLLDDVTVQADDGRTRQLLELLLRLSEQRQIILFAQEPVVLDWARERLAGDSRHRVEELPRLTAV